MKKYFYLFAMMLLTATAFTSCSDDEGSKEDLVGYWRGVTSDGWEKTNGEIDYEWNDEPIDDVRLVFTEDGEFMEYYRSGSKWYLDISGTFTYKDSKIYVESDGETEYLGKVKKLTSETLVIELSEKYEEDGDTYEWYEVGTFQKESVDK